MWSGCARWAVWGYEAADDRPVEKSAERERRTTECADSGEHLDVSGTHAAHGEGDNQQCKPGQRAENALAEAEGALEGQIERQTE